MIPVELMRRWCSSCSGERDMDVARDAVPVSGSFADNLGVTEVRHFRCLHCGFAAAFFLRPGQFEQAQRSALYVAA